MASNKLTRRQKIHKRIRKNIVGTSSRPRMAVYRSNSQIYVQLIDDLNGKTLLSFSSLDESIKQEKLNKIEKSKIVGKSVAQKALSLGILTVSFDRGGYLYHGRIKALADGARGVKLENGSNEFLQF
jgi:large subunit ribosomal protein L18